MQFDLWKEKLLCDAERRDNRRAVECMSDYVLGLFWREHVRPEVNAVLAACEERVLAA